MFSVQELFADAIKIQEEITHDLLIGIASADKKSREKLVTIYRAKIQDKITSIKSEAHAEMLRGKANSRIGSDRWAKALREKNETQELDELRESTEDLIAKNLQAQLEDHEHNFRLETTRADILEDHLYRCMGIYLEQRFHDDELNMSNIRCTVGYMNMSSTALLKKICKKIEECDTVDPQGIEAMMDIIESDRSKLRTYAKKITIDNGITNSETIENLVNTPLLEL